jgi:glycosyltransferase involved in cell wall biosynthesis
VAKKVLFFRDFDRFYGGHFKVWNYFNHVLSSPSHTANILFSANSIWDQSNPWIDSREYVVDSKADLSPDILFVAGVDWLHLDESERDNSSIPIINLIQSPQHADPGSLRSQFLRHKAVRICVSEEIEHALRRSGSPNGPLMTIPLGFDTAVIPAEKDYDSRTVDILIAGLKQPDIARQVFDSLAHQALSVQLITEHLPREEYLARVADSRILVCLPLPREGFYLPALEAMAAGTLVICPDCVGNRGFCIDSYTCLKPEYTLEGIVKSVEDAVNMSSPERGKLQIQARMTTTQHDLMAERRSFLEVLNSIDQGW